MFKPLLNTAKSVGKAVLKSDAGKSVLKAAKHQAVESGERIATDVIEGHNIGESMSEEIGNIKDNIHGRSIDLINKYANVSSNRRSKYKRKPCNKKIKRKKQKNGTREGSNERIF